jgi:hypothetical protein
MENLFLIEICNSELHKEKKVKENCLFFVLFFGRCSPHHSTGILLKNTHRKISKIRNEIGTPYTTWEIRKAARQNKTKQKKGKGTQKGYSIVFK